jgi:hypothetical protein
MAATIRSSSDFAAGNIAMLGHDFTVSDDGLVAARFNFACLGTTAVVSRNLRRFIPDALPPVPLPADMTALRLENGAIYLSEVSSKIDRGICYINANYVGSNADQSRRVNENWVSRTFGGTIIGRSKAIGNPTVLWGTVKFDYTAIERTVSWTAIQAAGEPKLESEAVNIRNFIETRANVATAPTKLGKGYMLLQTPTLQTDKIGVVTRYRKTVTGEFVSDHDGQKLLRPDRNDSTLNIATNSGYTEIG